MAAARIVRTALASSLQSSRQLSNGVRVAAAPASIVASWRATAAFSTSSASRQAACPSCGAALSSASAVPSVTCSSCDAIVPPPSDTSYFALLGDQTPSFRPDMASVKRAFLTLQQKVHPDRVGGGRDKEESAARAWSAVVNEAYKTLGDNLRRAEYLIKLYGVEVGENESLVDPELLMQTMETREALEEASTQEQVDSIRESNRADIDSACDILASIFPGGSADARPSNEQLDEAKKLVIRLRYLYNIEGVCRDWQPGKRIELSH